VGARATKESLELAVALSRLGGLTQIWVGSANGPRVVLSVDCDTISTLFIPLFILLVVLEGRSCVVRVALAMPLQAVAQGECCLAPLKVKLFHLAVRWLSAGLVAWIDGRVTADNRADVVKVDVVGAEPLSVSGELGSAVGGLATAMAHGEPITYDDLFVT
jgi:hypothetical protein